MRFEILTLLPDFFTSPLGQGVIGRAVTSGIIGVGVHNIRDYTTDRHRTADDSPYGGGSGMVMKPEPVVSAIEGVLKSAPAAAEKTRVVLTTPQGRPFDQARAREYSGLDRLVIVCGRYEGVDERVRAFVDDEVSVGDFIMTGGEAPALCVVDAVARLVPGVLGGEDSTVEETFSEGLIEYPQYTRPEVFRGMGVPEILLSGNHGEIRKWRRRESLRRTLERRPELLSSAELTDEDRAFLKDLKIGKTD